MSTRNLHRVIPSVCVVAVVLLLTASAAEARRETSVANRFTVFVPPNNDAGTRFSAIVITSVAGSVEAPNLVSLIDDGADGDSDDTVLDVPLVRGASLVRYIKDGAVNDDASGRWDGDLMHVRSAMPVSVMLVTDSDWQHTFAPADDGSMRGQRFFLYANRTSTSPRDIDVFAYDDDTRVALYDITKTALVGSGVTTIGDRGPALFTGDLNEGETTMTSRGLGVDLLVAGRTYEVVTSKPVTVMYGAIASLNNVGGVRDGGTYVPGRSGSARDRDFYFTIPHDPGLAKEAELRVVAAEGAAAVELFGFDVPNQRWTLIDRWSLAPFDHADVVGPGYALYHLTSSSDVVVFEANWLETGSPGTSDVASFVPGFLASDGSQRFVSYLGPPGKQTNTTVAGTFTHLYLFSDADVTGIRAIDTDTGGTITASTSSLRAGSMVDLRYDVATWQALNRTAVGIRPYIRIDSPAPIAVCMANWNDNWMTYANSVVLRNPEVTLTSPTTVQLGKENQVASAIANTGADPLLDVVVSVTIPRGTSYVSGDLDGSNADLVEAQANGSVLATFSTPELLPGATSVLTMVLLPETGSVGEIVGADVVVQANTVAGVALSSSTSAPLLMASDGVVGVAALEALPAAGRVVLGWEIDAPAGTTARVAVSRSLSASGPFVELTALAVLVQGPQLGPVSVVDATVTNGTRYYYRIDAVGPGGSSSAGPVTVVPKDSQPPPVPVLQAVAGDRRVDLVVGGSRVSDLAGYHIERSRDGERFTRITTTPIAGPGFTDTAVDNGRAVAYRAAAIDTTGNLSAASNVVLVMPQTPASRVDDTVVFFEDMIGAGDNDWDYNDFIVRVSSRVTIANGGFATVVLDLEPLARGAGYVHRLHLALPGVGPWSASVTTFTPGAAFVVDSTRTSSGTGPLDLLLYQDTRDALAPIDGAYSNTTPQQGTFEPGAAVHVEVTFAQPILETAERFGAAPFDLWLEMPWLPAPNAIHLPAHGGPTEKNERGPLAGSSLDFALVVPSVDVVVDWPFEGEAVWRPFPAFIDHLLTPTSSTETWPDTPTGPSRTFNQQHRRNAP